MAKKLNVTLLFEAKDDYDSWEIGQLIYSMLEKTHNEIEDLNLINIGYTISEERGRFKK